MKPSSQPAVLASACCRLAKTWAKKIRTWWIPPPWWFGSTHTRRSMFTTRETFSAFELRLGYGFTACTDNARALYVHEHITHCLQIITCSASRVVRTWSVRGLCLHGTSSVYLCKKRTKLKRTLSCKYIVARCAHWPTPNSGRQNSRSPHLQRASK